MKNAWALIVAALVAGISISSVATSGCSDGQSGGAKENVPSGSTAVGTEVSTTTTIMTTTATAVASSVLPEVPLFDFDSTDSAEGWSVVNDTVMGGVSSGLVAVENGSLIFSGELSLDNNGGFASVRSPAIQPEWADAWSVRSGPRIAVEGDGRTWTVEVRTDDPSGGWVATLVTSRNSVTDVTLPWTSFAPVTRFLDPREAAVPLDPRRIASIAFYLVDGVEGSFRLGILSIG